MTPKVKDLREAELERAWAAYSKALDAQGSFYDQAGEALTQTRDTYNRAVDAYWNGQTIFQ